MYFSIKIDSADPRVEKTVDCASLEDVNKFLRKHISFTQPRNWMNELDRDITQIEDTDMRHNEKVRSDIINALLKPDCTKIHIIDNCFIFGSSPCNLKIKKVKHVGEKAENVFIDDCSPVKDIYRTFQVTPEKVIFNDPATIVFWKDGTKTVVKCMEGDTYNPEVGLAMCVCKKLYGSKYHRFFKYYTKDAPTRPLLGNVTEATAASYYNPVDEVINLIKAVFEDTRGESK